MSRLLTVSALTLVFTVGIAVVASDRDQEERQPKPTVAADDVSDSTQPAPSDAKAGGKDEATRQSSRWMLFKLTSSQAIFTDLTRGDLEGVAKNARASQVIDTLEYWLRGKEFRHRSAYHEQLNRYQFSVRELARHADDGNIDGALESWLDISRSCVECHKLLRDPGRVAAPSEGTKSAE